MTEHAPSRGEGDVWGLKSLEELIGMAHEDSDGTVRVICNPGNPEWVAVITTNKSIADDIETVIADHTG